VDVVHERGLLERGTTSASIMTMTSSAARTAEPPHRARDAVEMAPLKDAFALC
jgi:hypothetical protein